MSMGKALVGQKRVFQGWEGNKRRQDVSNTYMKLSKNKVDEQYFKYFNKTDITKFISYNLAKF